MRPGVKWKSVEERFLEKVVRSPVTGCWLWRGCQNHRNGYPHFRVNGKMVLARRWAYEHYRGPIPAGLVCSHDRRRRRCVNPAHVELVTHSVSTLRGRLPELARQRQLSKTHCPQGHTYAGDNLYVHPGTGSRYCRKCRVVAVRKCRAARQGREKRERKRLSARPPSYRHTKGAVA